MSTPYERAHPHHRPLIDHIPDHNDLDVSDEEDAFYALDEGDYLLHPKWRAVITQTTNRVPRRLQRYFVIYFALFVIFCIGWGAYFGPQYAVYKQELRQMEEVPEASFGKNKRPEFGGMVQVKRLEEKWLPRGEGRLVVVGDVHGCIDEFRHLMRKVEFVEGRDHLILAGDIISKGPDSPGVVSYAAHLGASCVRGNHEDKVLLSLAETSTSPDPGPIESPALPAATDALPEESFSRGDFALRKLAKSFKKSQIAWLQSCPVILHVGKIGELHDVVVVHAGLVPDIALEDQDPFQVMNMRTVDLKTRTPSEGREGTPWEKLWNHVQKKKPAHERMTVIYGHDRKRGKNIQKHSMGLDSGCVSGGHLTAMVIEEGGKHHYVQVKCKGYVD
ncbi:ser/Thr protein phosphatase-like protein family [Lentithecium fluviatile CBS 122367]|uniref:Ser/Thr protein phosphatase-like protein family n=1 Tax=Lentithecium fluviatile CBS 122367 TaxID=1168545 RepID=A0A6G1J7R8_9PLEO|nr:ser/Thr protein phosphatase-like protein family [Lentithecium fluviatile CBS 122367]